MGKKWREQQAKKGGNNSGGGQKSNHKQKPHSGNPKQGNRKLMKAYVPGQRAEVPVMEVFEAFCNWCQSELPRGGDIAKGLRDGKRIDLDSTKPTMKVSTATNTADKDRENEEFKIDYRIQQTAWRKHEEELKESEERAYARFFEMWTDSLMKSRLKADPDFKTVIQDDPYKVVYKAMDYARMPVQAENIYMRMNR